MVGAVSKIIGMSGFPVLDYTVITSLYSRELDSHDEAVGLAVLYTTCDIDTTCVDVFCERAV